MASRFLSDLQLQVDKPLSSRIAERLIRAVFCQEECRSWGINARVLKTEIWPAFVGAMRQDFPLFDEYQHDESFAGARLSSRIVVLASKDDPKVGHLRGNPHFLQGWSEMTTGDSEILWLRSLYLSFVFEILELILSFFSGDHFYLADPENLEVIMRKVGMLISTFVLEGVFPL